MAFRRLTYGYHDAQLEACELGPQREVVLQVRLDPVWNRHAPRYVRLRFGAIQNFDEVQVFFERLKAATDRPPEGYLDGIAGIACTSKCVFLRRQLAADILVNLRPQLLRYVIPPCFDLVCPTYRFQQCGASESERYVCCKSDLCGRRAGEYRASKERKRYAAYAGLVLSEYSSSGREAGIGLVPNGLPELGGCVQCPATVRS